MTLSIGQQAKEFNLPDVDGKSHALSEFKDRKAVLIIFPATIVRTCRHTKTASWNPADTVQRCRSLPSTQTMQ